MATTSPERMPMYGWYDPRHLLKMGIRVGIATIFGEFLDRRELFGNRDDPSRVQLDPQHDYSNKEELWLDFAADSGDGWEPTYAMARLLARESLVFSQVADKWTLGGQGAGAQPRATTHRGHVLVFGGDQVYATASRDEYKRRFIAPFEEAARTEGMQESLKQADVYAIPGNHDWYDGLNAFMGLFCARRPDAQADDGFGAGRRIGGRLTRQTRSYFALKLPHDWWLLGADAQLTGYLDRGQIAFFDDVAQKLMAPGSNVILCAGMPSWAYVGLDGGADTVFRNYSYLESVVAGTARERGGQRHNLRLVLTGDSHHYARFSEGNAREDVVGGMRTLAKDSRCYLTWGGAGAFLHPTHQLENVSFEWEYPPPPPVVATHPPGAEPSYQRSFTNRLVHPDAKTSRSRLPRLWLFAYDNPWFTGLLFAVAFVVAWTLAAVADFKGERLPESLRMAPSWCEAVRLMGSLLLSAPWFSLACVGLAVTLIYFSAALTTSRRVLVGILHFAAHLASFFTVFVIVARRPLFGTSPVWLVIVVAALTAVLSATIMGIYLQISLRFFRRHWNEAFSALRIKDFKGFLRLHVDRDGGLAVYPICLDKVPKGGDGPLAATLIESPIRLPR